MKECILRFSLCIFAVAAMITLSACAAKEEEAADEPDTIEIAPTEAETQAHNTKYKDGVYSAGRRGYGGDVVVTATIANDEIVELKIEGADETKGVGSVAIERMRERIMEAQFGAVDAVSGASETSEAIKGAFEDLLRKAEY